MEEKTTSTAVICAGNTCKTLAGLLSKAVEPMVSAASRAPTGIAHQLGGSVTAATVVDAMDQSEAVVRSPTVSYAFMQAAGLVNDHIMRSIRHPELAKVVAP